MRRVQRRKKPLDYLLPFLILVSVGVIIVLGAQLVVNWGKQGKGDVFFYVAEGKAKILPFGNTDWDNAFSGTRLLLGDSLKTSSSGKTVLSFFNGTIIRMGDDTAVTLSDVTKDTDKEIIALNLDNGVIWVNGEKSEGVREAHYEVRTKNMNVKATGTVFEVESDGVEIVRVFDGEVEVDIIVEVDGNERVADTIPVGVGQEVYIDDAAIKAFEDNKEPSVLNAVSDEFKKTDWYKWNIREDKSPTDFSSSSKSTIDFEDDEELEDADDDDADDDVDAEEDTDDEEDDTENNLDEGAVKAPKILQPSDTTISTGKVTISGTVGSDVEKVVVEADIDGLLDSYTLSQFKSGDTVWSYNVSEQFGNLQKGDNTYYVYAYDSENNKSEAAKITITWGESDDDSDIELDDDLTDPKVLTYNGSSSSEVTEDTVTISGSIKGAAKVVVNGYTLSKFQPGDASWSYIASESLGNLKPGENTYSVYGVDPDGNKSTVVEFTITYNKSGDTSDTADTTDDVADETPVEDDGIVYGF